MGDKPPIIRSSKTVIAASGFTYVFGCRLPLRSLSHRSGNRQPKTYVKPEDAITVFELLMVGGVSPETCSAIKKHCNNKFYYTVASCWFFLWDLHTELSVVFIHTSSTVVSLLQHAIRWWIVETWALHVRCSCRLTAIRLVHTMWSIQWHYPLFITASWYQALLSLLIFLFLEKKVGLLTSLACCVLCVGPFECYEPVNQNPRNTVPRPCHYTPPNWHTYLFSTISDNMVAMWTCQMGVPGQVHQGSCIMDGNRYSKSVSLLLR